MKKSILILVLTMLLFISAFILSSCDSKNQNADQETKSTEKTITTEQPAETSPTNEAKLPMSNQITDNSEYELLSQNIFNELNIYKESMGENSYDNLAESIIAFLKDPKTYDLSDNLPNDSFSSINDTFQINEDIYTIRFLSFDSGIGEIECTSIFVQIVRNDKILTVKLLNENTEHSFVVSFTAFEIDDEIKLMYTTTGRSGQINFSAIYSYIIKDGQMLLSEDFDEADKLNENEFFYGVSIYKNCLFLSTLGRHNIEIKLPDEDNQDLIITAEETEYRFIYKNNKYILAAL